MNEDDVGDAQARRLGAILEDLVLAGASQEVLGSFALRHVRRLSASEPAQLGVTDMEVLLERFGKQVAREVLKESGLHAATPGQQPAKTKVRTLANLPEPGTLAALQSSPSRKISCKLMGRSTSISVPSDLHDALVAQVGPAAVRSMITQWAGAAPQASHRSFYVQSKMASAWQQNHLMATGTPFQGLLQ